MNSNGFQQSEINKYASSSLSNTNDIDVGNDIVKSGNIFMSDPKKHEDLKLMLESSKDSSKLEAMKRIITMVAKGKDCSDLFPSVVKNVVAKNAEVKKLVYAYLTRYAEEKQDLALLSISTFQRALKDPNQLIRGSALRVLSSIRVPMIIPIMMLSIKECVTDMSPYVRKIAAHAIPKMYSLDPSTKDQLIEVIEKLLADKTTLVAGSVIQAFEEVCPERLDLIHKHYRKLCALLIDVEEWGQIVIINMLTRYARTQFVDPNSIDIITENKKFYSDDESSSSTESDNESASKKKLKSMDPDHRLLLNSVKPLLQSRNSAVVMSVVQLYYHCASAAEMNVVIRSLIRLLKSYREVQFVVLNNIATMTTTRPALFSNHLKSFYVYNSDSIQVKLLKLEILTNLANESNISVVLRELQSYVTNTDQEFVKSTIQAIGRCASNISEVSDNCLSGLVQLISKKDENIVAEAVVVIRKLLQMQSCDHRDIIVNLALLLDTINVPMAKASIIWLIGEYCDRVPKLAPDVLRKAAKSFVDEKDIVKLQTINLASKLYITNPKQTHLLVQYVLNLAKYDLNYDIRDRARFVRALLFPQSSIKTTEINGDITESDLSTSNQVAFLSKKIKKIFLATKPAPLLESKFKDRLYYQLGTMSHILNYRVAGYKELPEWPSVAPDATVRHVEEPKEQFTTGGALLAQENISTFKSGKSKSKKSSTMDSFYSESSSEESEKEEEDSEEESEEEEDEEDSDEEKSSSEDEKVAKNKSTNKSKETTKLENVAEKTTAKSNDKLKEESDTTSDEEEDSDEEEEDDSEEETESSSESSEDIKKSDIKNKKPIVTPSKKETSKITKTKPPAIDLLLDFEDAEPSGSSNVMQPMLSPTGVLQPSGSVSENLSNIKSNKIQDSMHDCYIPSNVELQQFDLISKYSNSYICVRAEFHRSLSVTVHNAKFVAVNLIITNLCDDTLHNIHIVDSTGTADVHAFSQIDSLLPHKTVTLTLGVDFKDSSQPVNLTLGLSIFIMRDKDDQVAGALDSTTTPANQEDAGDTTTSKSPTSDSTRYIEQDKKFPLKLTAPIGELLQSTTMTTNEFHNHQKKLRGMNESVLSLNIKPLNPSSTLLNKDEMRAIIKSVYSVCNVITVANNYNSQTNSFTIQVAGVWSSSRQICLIELTVKPPITDNDIIESTDTAASLLEVTIKVNSEHLTSISQLAKSIKESIVKSRAKSC